MVTKCKNAASLPQHTTWGCRQWVARYAMNLR